MGKLRAAAAGPMPDELMMGPCIEVWADKDKRPEWASSSWPAYRARRHWQDAVKAWAVESGWATEQRPAANAMNLARTRLPWSRVFLLGQGRGEYVDYLEGRRAACPDEGGGWQPREGPAPPPASTRP